MLNFSLDKILLIQVSIIWSSYYQNPYQDHIIWPSQYEDFSPTVESLPTSIPTGAFLPLENFSSSNQSPLSPKACIFNHQNLQINVQRNVLVHIRTLKRNPQKLWNYLLLSALNADILPGEVLNPKHQILFRLIIIQHF